MSIHMRDKTPKTYVVLGMHKSGTSFISKALSEQNVSMGVNNFNVYENSSFVDLNNEFLKECGGSWNDPPTEEVIREKCPSFKERAKNLITYFKKEFWGFKDPRTALTFPLYEDLLEDDVYLVCMFRKPQKLVEKGIGRDLVDTYNQRILKIIERFIK